MSVPKKLFVFLSSFLCIALLYAQDTDEKGIYIWDFKTKNGMKNALTENLTDEYEVLLKNTRQDFILVNRRNWAEIKKHQEQEATIAEIEGQIANSKKLNKVLSKKASVVILGVLSKDPYLGEYVISVRYNEIESQKLLHADRVRIPEKKINESAHIRTALSRLIPEQSVLSFQQGNSTKDKSMVVSSSKKELIIDADFVKTQEDPWRFFQAHYQEDFTDRDRRSFLQRIWNKRIDSKGRYEHFVKNKKYYFQINKENLIRHKYIGAEGVHYDKTLNPYAVSVYLDFSKGKNTSYGRGLTIRYDDTGKKSCYAFVLNDEGELKFLKVGSIGTIGTVEPLHIQKVEVTNGGTYDLGVVCIDNRFYLFFDKKFIKLIEDDELQGDKNGIICFGKGTHYLDNISIYEPTYIK